MMIDVLFVDEWVILDATALMCSVMAMMNLATLHRTGPIRFLSQEHHATKTDLIQGINISGEIDHIPPIMVPDIADISANHIPTAIPIVKEAAVSEGTHCAPLPATAAACTGLWLMDALSPFAL